MRILFFLLLLSPASTFWLSATANTQSIDFMAPQVFDLQTSEEQVLDADTPPMLEFSLEESDAAIALFGCDCPAHLNSLRALRGQEPLQLSREITVN